MASAIFAILQPQTIPVRVSEKLKTKLDKNQQRFVAWQLLIQTPKGDIGWEPKESKLSGWMFSSY